MDFLADPLAPILAGFYALIPSYGLAIILLTLATRILLLPLSIKSTRSMREMQLIQPEVKRLQKKYKGNRQKLNEEVMGLYKEHGVNPFGGCLPLLLQLPVFFALFYLVRNPLAYLAPDVALASDLKEKALAVHDFLGLRLDCSPTLAYSGGASPIETIGADCGGGILAALPYFALLALMGLSTLYQQRQMMATRGGQTDPQQQQMQTFMKVFPLILVVFGIGFPMGVVLYWVTTNLWTIVQQRIMLRAAPPIEPGAKESKPSPKDKAKESKPAPKSKAKTGALAPATEGSSGSSNPGTAKSQTGSSRSGRSSSKKKKKKR